MGRVANAGRCLGLVRGERRVPKSLGRVLNNRDVLLLYGGGVMVKTRKLHTVTQRHCMAMEFITQMEMGGASSFQDAIGKLVGKLMNF